MKVAYIQLKNGYTTLVPCEFMSEENERLCLWGEKGRVGIFPLNQVEMCVITERNSGDVSEIRKE